MRKISSYCELSDDLTAVFLNATLRLDEEVEARKRLYRELKGKTYFDGLVGSSPRMLEIIERIEQVGPTQATVLIDGESGTGKDHGANRTGRMFTGDRSGDWLYRAMHEHGFASQPDATAIGDGLKLEDAYITATAHCAPPDNTPTRQEIEACRGYLVRELEALADVKVVLVLGRIAFDGFLAAWRESGLPGGVRLLGSYHPSQQNTFTGRLTRSMFHRVLKKARDLVDS